MNATDCDHHIYSSVVPNIFKACQPCKPSAQIFDVGRKKALMYPQTTPKNHTPLELFLGENTDIYRYSLKVRDSKPDKVNSAIQTL